MAKADPHSDLSAIKQENPIPLQGYIDTILDDEIKLNPLEIETKENFADAPLNSFFLSPLDAFNFTIALYGYSQDKDDIIHLHDYQTITLDANSDTEGASENLDPVIEENYTLKLQNSAFGATSKILT